MARDAWLTATREQVVEQLERVFGHHWRFWSPESRAKLSQGEPNLFESEPVCGWHKNNEGREVAFCVDYSAGVHFKERKHPRTGPFHGRLAALRWPEREVVFDDDPPGRVARG